MALGRLLRELLGTGGGTAAKSSDEAAKTTRDAPDYASSVEASNDAKRGVRLADPESSVTNPDRPSWVQSDRPVTPESMRSGGSGGSLGAGGAVAALAGASALTKIVLVFAVISVYRNRDNVMAALGNYT